VTIGELYIRQGETFQAIDYFERLAQIFVGDGFSPKAIAVTSASPNSHRKKSARWKSLPTSTFQQGVMSEARPLFPPLAEIPFEEQSPAGKRLDFSRNFCRRT